MKKLNYTDDLIREKHYKLKYESFMYVTLKTKQFFDMITGSLIFTLAPQFVTINEQS